MNENNISVASLVETAKAGDRVALEKLIVRYRPYLRLIAEQEIGPALGRRYDGSDIAQQTCMEAIAALAGFKGASEPEFSAWIKQILRRNVLNLIRDNQAAKRDMRREKTLFEQRDSASVIWTEPAAGDRSPSQMVVQGEKALLLASALDQLPAEQREAIKMRYLEGRTVSEIANQLGKTRSSIAGLLHRGLQLLQKTTDSI